MLIIGICGASGSGKSTLARELARRIHQPCVLLRQDAYYHDHPELTFEERRALNFDEPASFDHDALYQDLLALQSGEPIQEKDYDFALHRRCDTQTWLQPADVAIVEGIHAFYDPRVRAMMDLKLFVQVDPDICLLRRIRRDIRDRGRDVDDISRQYLGTVKPMYERHIRNYVDFADVIVAHGGKNQKIVEILGHYINTRLIPAGNAGNPSE